MTSAVYCDLKHVLPGALYSQHMKSIVGMGTDLSYTILPRQPTLSFSINTHTNKPFLRKEPLSWVYIFAGNYHFFDTWLGSTVTNRIHSGFLEPQTWPTQRHHFWTVALSAWNVSVVLVDLSIALTMPSSLWQQTSLAFFVHFPVELRILGLNVRGPNRRGQGQVFINISGSSPKDRTSAWLVLEV